MSSVVHATEIHLRSLVGTRTCMHVHTNSVGLDAQSEQDISKSSSVEKSVYAFMTSADRLLNNHVVISEDRNSCYRKTSAQPNQKMSVREIISTFAGLQKHFLFISFFMTEAYAIGLLCSARMALVLQGHLKTCLHSLIRKYVLERLSSDYLTIHQCSGVSAEWHRDKR